MRILKCLLIIITINLLLFFGGSYAQCVQSLYLSASFDSQINRIQNDFSQILPPKNTIAYTKVPRGLILSISEEEFFAPLEYSIKPSGKNILNNIISVLQEYDNDCVIESHTDESLPQNSLYSQDWELSIARANAVADYIVKTGKIKSGRIFPVGFGEMMPFKENVSKKGFSDRRIDFVIFDYDVTR